MEELTLVTGAGGFIGGADLCGKYGLNMLAVHGVMSDQRKDTVIEALAKA